MPRDVKARAQSNLVVQSQCDDRGAAGVVFPVSKAEVRKHPRYYFRTLATATIHAGDGSDKESQECFVLTRDLSRGGVSFLHPARLAVGQRVDLTFEDGRELLVAVLWVRRLSTRCFWIGCNFLKAD